MKFWEIYFAVVAVMKRKIELYEEMLTHIPLSQSSTPASPRGMIVPKSKTALKSVLVVEPLERNRVLIARYLGAHSVQAEFVKTEAEANERVSAGAVGLKINTTGMRFPEEKETLLSKI